MSGGVGVKIYKDSNVLLDDVLHSIEGTNIIVIVIVICDIDFLGLIFQINFCSFTTNPYPLHHQTTNTLLHIINTLLNTGQAKTASI